MKKSYSFFMILLLMVVSSVGFGQKIKVNEDIELLKLCEGFYMHTTYSESPGFGRYPSNGILVIKNGKAFMIDSPVSNETTTALIDYLSDSMKVKLELFTGGHFHEDCIGGMSVIKMAGAKTFLNSMTKEKCEQFNLPLPDTVYTERYFFSFEGIPVECRWLGGGHTADNSIVYFPDQDIMFGGCLVKSNESMNLGNLGDATVNQWRPTIESILELYPRVKIIIPGHGNSGGKEMLTHTISLVDGYLKSH